MELLVFLCFPVLFWAVVLGLTKIVLIVVFSVQFHYAQTQSVNRELIDGYKRFLREHCHNKRVVLIGSAVTLLVLLYLQCASLVDILTITGKVQKKIVSSSKLVVRTGGNCHRDRRAEAVLFETQDPHEIGSFAEKVRLEVSFPKCRCMCCGALTFDLYNGDEVHYSFSLHHDHRIRIEGGSGDRELSASSKQLLKARMQEKGISARLEAFREEENSPPLE